MKRPILRLLMVMGTAACQGVICGADYRVDQQHDWPMQVENIASIQLNKPIVQEFTPAVGALDVVEIWTEDFGGSGSNRLGATLEVLLREDTTNGPVLATSAPISLPDGWSGSSRFYFTNVVWLTPEARYALELRVVTGDNWGVHSYGQLFPPTYPRGRYFVAGQPTESHDMWFRTGIRMPTPQVLMEQGSLRWQGVPPLNYRIWGSVNLRDWGEVGQLSSLTTNYWFTNLALGEPKLFFRVSQP